MRTAVRMSDLEDLLEAWGEDASLDNVELDRASMTTPVIHARYMRLLSESRIVLRGLETGRRELSRTLRDYYCGYLNDPEVLESLKRPPYPRKLIRTELDTYVNSDEEMLNLDNRIAVCREYVEACQEILKQVNNRNWTVRNIIEWRRLTQFSDDG